MKEISGKYFDILRTYFEPLYERASKKGYSSSQIAKGILEIYPYELLKNILQSLIQDLKGIDWKSQKEFLESIKGQRTAYLGHALLYSNNPENTSNFLTKTALYSDTTIINDPILSELLSWEKRSCGDASTFNLVAQFAVRLLKMEPLFSSDLKPPICCLAPCSILSLGSQDAYGPIDELIEEFVVPAYASKIFNKQFNSSDNLVMFLQKFKDFNEFKSIVEKSEVPFANYDGSQITRLDFNRVKSYYENRYETSFDMGKTLFLLLRRCGVPAYDLAVNGSVATNFATDFRGVWDSFVWLLNNDNTQISKQVKNKPLSKDTLVLNSLQSLEFKWIGNVPINKIIEMRKGGELQDMRELLSRSVTEIESASDDEFAEVGRQVEYNLEQAFKKHRNEINKFSEDCKTRYKIDAVSIAVTGTFGFISAMYPPLAQSIGFLSPLLVERIPVSKLIRDFFEEWKSLRVLRRKPVGILFETKEKYQKLISS